MDIGAVCTVLPGDRKNHRTRPRFCVYFFIAVAKTAWNNILPGIEHM